MTDTEANATNRRNDFNCSYPANKKLKLENNEEDPQHTSRENLECSQDAEQNSTEVGQKQILKIKKKLRKIKRKIKRGNKSVIQDIDDNIDAIKSSRELSKMAHGTLRKLRELRWITTGEYYRKKNQQPESEENSNDSQDAEQNSTKTQEEEIQVSGMEMKSLVGTGEVQSIEHKQVLENQQGNKSEIEKSLIENINETIKAIQSRKELTKGARRKLNLLQERRKFVWKCLNEPGLGATKKKKISLYKRVRNKFNNRDISVIKDIDDYINSIQSSGEVSKTASKKIRVLQEYRWLATAEDILGDEFPNQRYLYYNIRRRISIGDMSVIREIDGYIKSILNRKRLTKTAEGKVKLLQKLRSVVTGESQQQINSDVDGSINTVRWILEELQTRVQAEAAESFPGSKTRQIRKQDKAAKDDRPKIKYTTDQTSETKDIPVEKLAIESKEADNHEESVACITEVGSFDVKEEPEEKVVEGEPEYEYTNVLSLGYLGKFVDEFTSRIKCL